MPINLKGIFNAGAEKLIGTIGKAIDDIGTSKEEKEAAKLALQQEINRHVEAMQVSADKELELQFNDKSNARQREVEIAKVTGHADKMNWFLCAIVMGLLIFITVALVYVEIPLRNEHVFMLIIGEILGFAGGIFTYQFGSSLGSRLKDMRPKQ